MKAAVLHAFGEAPRFEEFADPSPLEGEALLHVHAAALNPSTKAISSGGESAGPDKLPFVCGIEGVGTLTDGRRMFFGGIRHPYGSMAELAAAPNVICWPIPDGLDDAIAAALPNPGLSSWIPLTSSAKIAPGETVVILGATGTAGKLAVQIAKILGAARVVAAGRNPEVLRALLHRGADEVISLDQPLAELSKAFAKAAAGHSFDIVLDYVWGEPAQALLSAIPHRGYTVATEIRYVPIGSSAGPSISLDINSLRRTGVILGSGSVPPLDALRAAFQDLMNHAVAGDLWIDVEKVPLAQVETAWTRDSHGSRFVFVP